MYREGGKGGREGVRVRGEVEGGEGEKWGGERVCTGEGGRGRGRDVGRRVCTVKVEGGEGEK